MLMRFSLSSLSVLMFLDLYSSSCSDQDILPAMLDLSLLLQLRLLFGDVYHNIYHSEVFPIPKVSTSKLKFLTSVC